MWVRPRTHTRAHTHAHRQTRNCGDLGHTRVATHMLPDTNWTQTHSSRGPFPQAEQPLRRAGSQEAPWSAPSPPQHPCPAEQMGVDRRGCYPSLARTANSLMLITAIPPILPPTVPRTLTPSAPICEAERPQPLHTHQLPGPPRLPLPHPTARRNERQVKVQLGKGLPVAEICPLKSSVVCSGAQGPRKSLRADPQASCSVVREKGAQSWDSGHLGYSSATDQLDNLGLVATYRELCCKVDCVALALPTFKG